MNQIKSGLTRLKTRVMEKITETDDVLGFPGVSKDGLVQFIDRAHALTSRLEPIRGQFPIVTLKRKIMPVLERCKATLDSAILGEPDKAAFDEFLSGLTTVHDEIYLTYVIHCSADVNSEADLESANLALLNLRNEVERLVPEVEQINGFLGAFEERNAKVDELLAEQERRVEEATANEAEIQRAKTSALASAEVISKYEATAKNEQDTVNSLARKASKTDQHIKTVMAEVADKMKVIEETLSKASAAAIENEKQQREIAKTIEAASKYGMAVSFKERKDELWTPMICWSGVFVLAMIALFATGILYIVPDLTRHTTLQWTDLLPKITLVSPFIWMGWMAAKQYGYIARIREDYSFKYASALAFEGYKKEALNVDPALLRDLLDVATSNMSLNPLRIYSHDDNDASPIHDAFSRIFSREKGNGTEPERQSTKSSTRTNAAGANEESDD